MLASENKILYPKGRNDDDDVLGTNVAFLKKNKKKKHWYFAIKSWSEAQGM